MSSYAWNHHHFSNRELRQRVERLAKALEVLSRVKPSQFDMHTFYDNDAMPDDRLRRTVHPPEKSPCGTVGCAAGWCGTDPWFRKRRFTTDWMGNVRYQTKDNRVKDFTATLAFFKLNEGDACYIFSPDHYRYRGSENVGQPIKKGEVVQRIKMCITDTLKELSNRSASIL